MFATQRGADEARIILTLTVVMVSLVAVGPAQAARHVGRYQPFSATAVVAATAATTQAARHVAKFQPVSARVVVSALAKADIAIAQSARHIGKAFSASAAGTGAGVEALIAMAALLAVGLILALTSRPLAAGSASSAGPVALRLKGRPQQSTRHAA